jgi:hypothetical protein
VLIDCGTEQSRRFPRPRRGFFKKRVLGRDTNIPESIAQNRDVYTTDNSPPV